MISEGSCDTEYWSNDAENTAFDCKLHFKIYYKRISFCICNQINTALVKSYSPQTFER